MTDKATLTDRYVDAAMRTVPEKQRADLGVELHGSIADQIDARIDAGETPDAAEIAVLTELGDPDKLAAGYTGRVLHLIGPRYYLDWWRLLKLLLWIVPVCVAFGIGLGQALAGAAPGTIIGQMVLGVMQAILQVSFWTTLVFVILERTGHETMDAGPWTPDRLPEPKQSGAALGDAIAVIVCLLITAGAIVWDLTIGFVPGHPVSILNPQLWPWAVLSLFVVMALRCALAVAVWVRGRWTRMLATLNTVLALIVWGILAYTGGWVFNPALVPPLNPAFFEAVIGAQDAATVQRVLTVLIWAGAAVIVAWDAVDSVLKARRSRVA
ncbi:hypothetical protein LK09_09040 [Microbacterium mangrovi]|uniref:Uncharacterized protein n=1 Tax=Microbacterium mangrovi TaxID=1348253 RepID=A0A0B2A888_9MICO|nr:permease prefix domain 1-containing protein [Microbacterium mangrovi]KHK97978.1 hypothetical protein LK09_09040 [Microbacterium mangrovi]